MILEISKLCKSYGKFIALDNVDICMEKSMAYGLIGPNGAGKTTTLGIITRLIRPSAGEIRILGRKLNDPSLRKMIGYLPHETEYFTEKTPLKLMLYFAYLCGLENPKEKAKEVLKKVGIPEIDSDISTLSHGKKKLLGIAQAMIHDPEILILDEPYSGLDPATKRHIRKLLDSLGKPTLISSHNIDEIESQCEKIGIISKGKLVLEDSTKNIRQMKNQVVLEFDKVKKTALGKLRKLPGVAGVEKRENKVYLSFKAKVLNIHDVSAFLRKSHIDAISVKKGNSLEDVLVETSQP